MITPPLSTHSFYNVLLDKKAGAAALKTLVDADDFVENVLVTSTDFTSDIEAMVECQLAVDRVAAVVEAKDIDRKIDFNPLYLPRADDLFTQVEFDSDGDIVKVAGFTNPFISATVKLSAEELPEFISASVCWKQFELPPVKEILREEGKVLLS